MFGHAMAMNQTCYGLCSKVGVPFALYCHARHFIERLVQGGHGSIFDTITTSTFEATDVLLAPKDVQVAFDEQVTPLFRRVLANLHESCTLTALRDALLPKLLSGDLRVAAAPAATSHAIPLRRRNTATS
jgi:type I restriction enzyme, S subunit